MHDPDFPDGYAARTRAAIEAVKPRARGLPVESVEALLVDELTQREVWLSPAPLRFIARQRDSWQREPPKLPSLVLPTRRILPDLADAGRTGPEGS